MRAAVVLVVVVGCADDPCVGTLANICGDAARPTQPLQLDGPIDTSSDPRCIVVTQEPGPTSSIPAARPELCVLAGSTIEVTGTVHAHGARALVLVASDAVTVNGTLDVSSRRADMALGAGADAIMSNNAGDGGSFFPSGVEEKVTFVRGGAAGGCDSAYATAHSGGALYVIAGNQIVVDGNMFASAGAPVRSDTADGKPGCGGASGGLIALEAPHVDIAGIVAANGSGGAVGHLVEGNASPGPETRAEDGTTTDFTTPAQGGTLSGGHGGNGGVVDMPATSGASGDGIGPGGGGGSVGVLWVRGELSGSQFSPAPTGDF